MWWLIAASVYTLFKQWWPKSVKAHLSFQSIYAITRIICTSWIFLSLCWGSWLIILSNVVIVCWLDGRRHVFVHSFCEKLESGPTWNVACKYCLVWDWYPHISHLTLTFDLERKLLQQSKHEANVVVVVSSSLSSSSSLSPCHRCAK